MITTPTRLCLALNENPLGPSPKVRPAIEAELSQLGSYAGSGIAELTRLIAARDRIDPDQIVLGEILGILGLYLAARGGPSGDFLYAAPGYTALVDAVAPLGGRAVAIPLAANLDNDFAGLEHRIDAATRAVFLVNPHNPTGLVADRSEFLAYVRRLSARTTVVVDEAYLDFLPDFAERSAAALVSEGSRVIVFRTFAKLHGLAGLGFGYALAPHSLAADLRRIGVGAFYGVSRLAVAAAIASLEDTSHLARVRAEVATERERWSDLLRSLGLSFTDSRGNFVFFDTRRPNAEVAAGLAQRGIDIGRSYPPLDQWVRISIGTPEQNETARRAVAELLQPGRP